LSVECLALSIGYRVLSIECLVLSIEY